MQFALLLLLLPLLPLKNYHCCYYYYYYHNYHYYYFAATDVHRVRVMTYNIGGISGEAYAVFCEWLERQVEADIDLVQELHWGCGKDEGTWMIGSWKAIVSADPGNRYCGVGIFLSPKLRADVSHCVWLPGRVLHARCETPLVTLDIVNVYQWAVDHRKPQQNESRRQQIWLQLSKLLQGLPRRNQLLLGMDANATCRPLAGLVGRGVPLAGHKDRRVPQKTFCNCYKLIS